MISGRVKQSRPMAAVGFIGGLIFVGIGVFIVIPKFGWFGVAWTAIAVLITAYRAYALISNRGGAIYEIEVEPGEKSSAGQMTERLSDLEEARKRGLVTEAEYQEQRAKIIAGA